MIKKMLVFLILMPFITACNNYKEIIKEKEMPDSNSQEKINMNINGENFLVILENNESAKSLLKMLPLKIEMQELNGNEKYYYFENSIPSNPSKIGSIKKGDLMLYESNCLVLFYKSFKTDYSYTTLGKIVNPEQLDGLMKDSKIEVLFTK